MNALGKGKGESSQKQLKAKEEALKFNNDMELVYSFIDKKSLDDLTDQLEIWGECVRPGRRGVGKEVDNFPNRKNWMETWYVTTTLPHCPLTATKEEKEAKKWQMLYPYSDEELKNFNVDDSVWEQIVGIGIDSEKKPNPN